VARKIVGADISFSFDNLPAQNSSVDFSNENLTQEIGGNIERGPGVKRTRKFGGHKQIEAGNCRFPPQICCWLSGFAFSPDLLLDLPVGKQILVTASRTLPGSLHWIGAALVKHLHDEMAMKAHGRMT
jgi:hypothetical protein